SWERFNSSGLLDRRISYTIVEKNGLEIFTATKNGIFVYKRPENEWKGLYVGMAKPIVKWLALDSVTDTLWTVCENRVYRGELSNNSFCKKEYGKADKILSRFKYEPTINEVMNMAIDYAEVYPEKIEKWRRGARFKALLPKLNVGIDRGSSDTYEIYTSSSTAYWMNGPKDNTEGWDLNLTWDLGDLIWNDAQTSIDVRSKLMVQLRDDIVDEVNRSYFERRRLQVELLMNPEIDVQALLKKRLRIQELTASLDGLTGGDFSQAIIEE
ncbi:MAG: hypothetical protein ABIH57_03480, partial [Candidatus Omnitrophota bacterium]